MLYSSSLLYISFIYSSVYLFIPNMETTGEMMEKYKHQEKKQGVWGTGVIGNLQPE